MWKLLGRIGVGLGVLLLIASAGLYLVMLAAPDPVVAFVSASASLFALWTGLAATAIGGAVLWYRNREKTPQG